MVSLLAHFIKMPAVNSNYQTVISARSARIRCRNCNSTCSAKTSLISSGCQISNLLKAKIATRLRSDVSAKTIAFEEVSHLLLLTAPLIPLGANFVITLISSRFTSALMNLEEPIKIIISSVLMMITMLFRPSYLIALKRRSPIISCVSLLPLGD